MKRKIDDRYTPQQLAVINRYRLERFARRYQADTSKIIKDTPESITIRLPHFTIPLLKVDDRGYEVGRVYMTNEIGRLGFRKLAFEYVKERANVS